MSKKTYIILKLGIIIALASIVSISVNYENWVLPIFAVIISFFILYTGKKKVLDVIEDERDYKIAGDAARIAITVYSFFAVILGLYLYIEGKESNIMYSAGIVLLYSAMVLMFIYSLLFKLRSRKNGNKD